jgi:mannose-1-phosphate guanylyltransferase / mannose-6-phosphate isomerase
MAALLSSAIVLEPAGKNTAPAAAVAALLVQEQGLPPLMALVSSDHVIGNESAFHEGVKAGVSAAQKGYMVSLAVEAQAPETGYGYIQRGEPLPEKDTFKIERFIEKPERQLADRFVAEGGYYWNAGLFVFNSQSYLDELEKHRPEMVAQCRETVKTAQQDLDFIRLGDEAFRAITPDSIDYAVMETTGKAAMVAVENMGWSDVGSWKSLWEVASQKDENGNVFIGDVRHQDASGNYVRTDQKQMVALAGVNDMVVVVTRDAVLVAHKDQSQDVKKIVEKLAAEKRSEAIHHRLVYRPWGSYESIDDGERYQVKRIVVKAGQKLSLQKHFHRAEHWVVVKGTAIVTRDKEDVLLQENESIYLPLGCVHRLENPGRIPLVLVEVQSGSYLGEDDIVRFQDTYGRTS